MTNGSGTSGTGFERRKAEVLATAKHIFNEQGMRGFSMASVAAALDVRPASVAYYFKRKEELVSACLDDTIRQYNTLIDSAEGAGSPSGRLRAFLDAYFELQRRARARTESAPISVSEIRLMTSVLEPAIARELRSVAQRLGELFECPDRPWLTPQRTRLIARLVIECVDWSASWLELYDPDEFAEVGSRLADVLERGFVTDRGLLPSDAPFTVGQAAADGAPTSRESFLRAATRLINLHGFHGVSVNAIAAELNLTKGAFYHHNEHKDGVLLACCERSLELIREAQARARSAPTPVERLLSAARALAWYQAEGSRGQMLRLYVVSELPVDSKRRIHMEYRDAAWRFAALISAGIAAGETPAMDPFLGGMVLIAMCNSAAYIEGSTGQTSARVALDHYARPCLTGIFNP